jgi:ribosomal peptide maturation radical SAM protein 1
MRRTLLVNMPCCPVERPSLALGLLKARLGEAGLECDVIYPNVDFAWALSPEAYRKVSTGLPYGSLAGEWVFSRSLFDRVPNGWKSYLGTVLRRQGPEILDALRAAEACARDFIDRLAASIDWRQYAVVGFTSLGDQNVASLALARRAKGLNPQAVVVFGGPNWHDKMGLAYHRHFPFVDAAFTGESDDTFPEFVKSVLADNGLGDRIPGVSLRSWGQVKMPLGASPVYGLDRLPAPDYSDYFRHLSDMGLESSAGSVLQLEASRGCWWADREPCRFCGQNGVDRPYRFKSGERVLSELRMMADSWPVARIELADNVVPGSFWEVVLPDLAARPLGVPLHVEVRPEVTRAQVELLAQSGTSIQVGVESLNDHVLELMHKGVRTLENIRLLRWCGELGVKVRWNFLCDVPGETVDDYRAMIALMPAIRFLPKPTVCSSVTLDRFSAFFERASEFGYEECHAVAAFECVYPLSGPELDEIAFVFSAKNGARERGATPLAFRSRLIREVNEWQRRGSNGRLQLKPSPRGSVLIDSRAEAVAAAFPLDGLDECLCAACDAIASLTQLLGVAEQWASAHGAPLSSSIDAEPCETDGMSSIEELVRSRLERFVANRLMVTDGWRYLCLGEPGTCA